MRSFNSIPSAHRPFKRLWLALGLLLLLSVTACAGPFHGPYAGPGLFRDGRFILPTGMLTEDMGPRPLFSWRQFRGELRDARGFRQWWLDRTRVYGVGSREFRPPRRHAAPAPPRVGGHRGRR